jgi:hypothetical protein
MLEGGQRNAVFLQEVEAQQQSPEAELLMNAWVKRAARESIAERMFSFNIPSQSDPIRLLK